MSSQKYGFKCEICGSAKISARSWLGNWLGFRGWLGNKEVVDCVKSPKFVELSCVEWLNLAESNAESPFIKWQLVLLKVPNCL